jgi:hypothetical protein
MQHIAQHTAVHMLQAKMQTLECISQLWQQGSSGCTVPQLLFSVLQRLLTLRGSSQAARQLQGPLNCRCMQLLQLILSELGAV